jgi:hypothetical protein
LRAPLEIDRPNENEIPPGRDLEQRLENGARPSGMQVVDKMLPTRGVRVVRRLDAQAWAGRRRGCERRAPATTLRV